MVKKHRVIAIVGPTASGKTKLAIDLAHKNNGEIISADSRMVYKYFDIATAKPTLAERDGVPHYLIDILEPEEDYSVANFVDVTKELIENISERGKLPIIVGGTGLYFKVLLGNYNLPRVAANAELREELENLAASQGVEKVHEILQKLDNEAAKRIHPNNLVRVIRSIEIIEAAKKPLAEIATKGDVSDYDIEWIGLNTTERSVLYERINRRVDEMLERGLIDEAKTLYEKYGKISSLMNTIGYQELLPYFDNEVSLDDAVDSIKQNTRRYAKRQLSLFLANPDINWRDL